MAIEITYLIVPANTSGIAPEAKCPINPLLPPLFIWRYSILLMAVVVYRVNQPDYTDGSHGFHSECGTKSVVLNAISGCGKEGRETEVGSHNNATEAPNGRREKCNEKCCYRFRQDEVAYDG